MVTKLEKKLYQGAWRKRAIENYEDYLLTNNRRFADKNQQRFWETAVCASSERLKLESIYFRVHAGQAIQDKRYEPYDHWSVKSKAQGMTWEVSRFIQWMDFPLSTVELGELYCSNEVQVSIINVINRMISKELLEEQYLLDLYQQSYTEFIKLAISFLYKCDREGEYTPMEFHTYIEHFLFKRLKDWYVRESSQSKYNWRAAKRGECKYSSLQSRLRREIQAGTTKVVGAAPDKYIRDIQTLSFDDMLGIVRASSSREAQCLELHYRQELKIEQIADKLGLAVGTVKAYLHSGRERLRAWQEGRAIS
ncbi:sigma factor-like helix-turn-helix DNA-binding protein [Paenibacillus validus]|uniref:sigma factor-like helix-turn-helix DNA-binding protein n=1 Tax=Paenibacillus validus TaxID=44253 RepID=UPI003D2D2D03